MLASINASTQQLLLIGDHQQLRPSVACHELALRYGLNVSLFERALNNRASYVKLRTQRRMRPSVARLIAPIYPDLLNHGVTRRRPRVAGMTTSVHFVTHNAPEKARARQNQKHHRERARPVRMGVHVGTGMLHPPHGRVACALRAWGCAGARRPALSREPARGRHPAHAVRAAPRRRL